MDYYMYSSPSFFKYQMKQSLEKLHSGIGVPELQQNPPDDTLTETLTEPWVFWSAVTSVFSKLLNLDKHQLCSFVLFCNWHKMGGSEFKIWRTTTIIKVGPQILHRYCVKTGHWWAFRQCRKPTAWQNHWHFIGKFKGIRKRVMKQVMSQENACCLLFSKAGNA